MINLKKPVTLIPNVMGEPVEQQAVLTGAVVRVGAGGVGTYSTNRPICKVVAATVLLLWVTDLPGIGRPASERTGYSKLEIKEQSESKKKSMPFLLRLLVNGLPIPVRFKPFINRSRKCNKNSAISEMPTF